MKKVFAAICITVILGTFSFAQEGLVVTKYPNGKVESEINYSNNIRNLDKCVLQICIYILLLTKSTHQT